MDVQISLGFDPSERAEVGRLYWQAFGAKLRAAFPDEATGLSLITSGLQSEHILVARVDGKVAGVCGFTEQGTGAVNLSWAHLRARLSRTRAVWAAIMLSILDRGAVPGILVLDGICVGAERRGRGIGSRLLTAASALAAQRGDTHVQLSVVSSNPRAEALYRRSGFETVERGSLGPMRSLFGFDRYSTMRRALA